MRLAAVLALLLGASVFLAGCYGSTEPATDIGFDHATMNGYGTTNKGPADIYFELWTTADPSQRRANVPQTIPGGVTGPFSQPTGPVGPYGLVPDTQYSFRLCGRDQGSQDAVCAQTRSFRTQKPAGDVLHGFFGAEVNGVQHTGVVQAESDRAGGGAAGHLMLRDETGTRFEGEITCLSVHGHDAAAGAVGQVQGDIPASGLLKVRDDPTPDLVSVNADQVSWTITPNGGAPNCAAASFDDVRRVDVADFASYDTP
jgi:hypothetical protein